MVRLVILAHCLISLSVLGFGPSYVFAEPSFKADLIIPLNSENAKSGSQTLDGYHGQAVKALLARLPNEVTFQKASPAHSYNGFYKGLYGCITPDSKAYYQNPDSYVESLPLSINRWLLVQKKNKAGIQSIEDLDGKKVALLFEPKFHHSFLPMTGVEYEVHNNLYANLKKVINGRNDAAVIPEAALEDIQKRPEIFNELSFNQERPLAEISNSILCHNTDQGRKLISIFNSHIKDIK